MYLSKTVAPQRSAILNPLKKSLRPRYQHVIMPPTGDFYGKNPERVMAGLKATIRNPNVSEEAKESAVERLREMGGEIPPMSESQIGRTGRRRSRSRSEARSPSVETNRVLGGYKATLHNPNTSEEAKRHAREILSAAGYDSYSTDETEHTNRVIAGYKAALHNPRVSPEAKQHAVEFLQANNVLEV
ncbi:putative conidiation protein 6 [Lyophyllum shimeji]|uniref:Conidiation protein 6 n=1 Tax=Lyophyllum shimeji TaxID=47721 RepID=A0A9P3ULY5_LYOSH|nr:putative conidiation protein 6 [Lyophyllum shimeji]